jgi:hypothetical protein
MKFRHCSVSAGRARLIIAGGHDEQMHKPLDKVTCEKCGTTRTILGIRRFGTDDKFEPLDPGCYQCLVVQAENIRTEAVTSDASIRAAPRV